VLWFNGLWNGLGACCVMVLLVGLFAGWVGGLIPCGMVWWLVVWFCGLLCGLLAGCVA